MNENINPVLKGGLGEKVSNGEHNITFRTGFIVLNPWLFR